MERWSRTGHNAEERARLDQALAKRDAELERVRGELRERTRELEQSRTRFRDVIERNADAIVVVDEEGVIRFANQVAAELFRAPREQLVGSPFGFPMLAGETTQLDLVHNGDSRVVEMRVVESEWEGRDASIATLRDITERWKAEEGTRRLIREQAARSAAEQAARRFRFLAESSTMLASSLDYRATLAALARLCVEEVADWAVIYIADDSGVVHRLQVAHRDPARAAAVREIRDHPIHPEGRHPVLEVLRTRSPLLMSAVGKRELASIAQDERHLALIRELGLASFMIVPLLARERCVGAIGLVSASPEREYGADDLALAQDLALRAALAVDNARLYQEAQQANQAKTDLLAVISHDLRTPLNSIMGHADLMAMGIPDSLSQASLEKVERIRSSARHLVYLIDELLSFARLEAGRVELREREVDLRALAQEVADVVEPLAQQRQLGFRLEADSDPLKVRTDPDKLRQVLLNLAGNAVKYTQQGEVRLRVRLLENGGCAVDVIDTGVGIDAAHLNRIFEPFWQVDGSQTSQDGGTGLGLSVVHRLVQVLGCEITVASRVGQGSTFTVIVPQRTPACPEDEVPAGETGEAPSPQEPS